MRIQIILNQNETRTGVNPFTASYAYDINSNRTQKIETVNGITDTINYEYNANDQLLSEVSSANGTTVYTYDESSTINMVTTCGIALQQQILQGKKEPPM